MTIWGLVQTKGGTGKSTIAQNLAFAKAVHRHFNKPGLVEFDPQGTLFKFWSKREAEGLDTESVSFYSIYTEDEKVIEQELGELARIHDLLILDVPGESLARFYTKFACAISDIALIPMRTTTKDEDAFKDNLLPILNQFIRIKPNGTFKVIPTFANPRAKQKNIIDYLNGTFPDHIRCINAVFPFRSILENYDRGGLNLWEFLNTVSNNKKQFEQINKAIQEVETIAKLLIKE